MDTISIFAFNKLNLDLRHAAKTEKLCWIISHAPESFIEFREELAADKSVEKSIKASLIHLR